MGAILRRHWLFILLLCGISIFYLIGVPKIPFHPDESTFLFMSSEFERTISSPRGLAWDNPVDLSPVMRYRMIDAPLTRYLIGIGRALVALPAPENDWDWSASWQDNQSSGGYPGARALLTGRLSVALLFPLSLILLYLIGLKLDGRLLGITAVILFSFNPLILLHTRRAMAEGVLIFAILLAVYALLYADRYPFLAGLAVALAFNAKHTAGLLLPAGIIAATWISFGTSSKYKHIASNLVRFTIGFGLLTILINPFLWRYPISAAQTALTQRQELIERQLDDFKHVAPAQLLESPGKRAAVAVAQVFIAPAVFSETGNYAEFTAEDEAAYLESFNIQIGRQPWSAGLLIGFAILGLIAAIRAVFDKDTPHQRNAALLLLSFFSVAIGIGMLVHLAWQRYYLPLIPFTALFAALGFAWGIKTSHGIFAQGRLSARLSQVLAQFTPDRRVS
jgi:4-amino-4-deoxy-L-arabinose transferase-like glycosyltransferase